METTLKELLNTDGVNLKKLASYVKDDIKNISLYIDRYDKGDYKNIPDEYKSAFDIVKEDQRKLSDVGLAYLIDKYKLTHSTKEKQFIKEFDLVVRSTCMDLTTRFLKQEKVRLRKKKDGSYTFSVQKNNILVHFKLIDEIDLYGNDDSPYCLSNSIGIHSYKDIKKILDDLSNIYLSDDVDDSSIYNVYECIEIYLSKEREDFIFPFNGMGMNDLSISFKSSDLLSEIKEIVTDLVDIKTYVDIEDLKMIKTLLLKHTPKIKELWRGKRYALVKRYFDNKLLICYLTRSVNVGPFLFKGGYDINGIFYYPINVDDVSTSDEIMKIAKDIDANKL